jgi:hypothetical protein
MEVHLILTRMTTKEVEISVSKDWFTAKGSEVGIDTANTTATIKVLNNDITYTYPISLGNCYIPACFPKPEMIILPLLFADTKTQIVERVYAPIAKLKQFNKKISCFVIDLVSCDEASSSYLSFFI